MGNILDEFNEWTEEEAERQRWLGRLEGDEAERQRVLQQLEEDAIEAWRETDGQIFTAAVLSYLGMPIAVIEAESHQGIATPLTYALSTGLADTVAIYDHCKIAADYQAKVVTRTTDGIDAIVLVVLTARQPTEQKVILVGTHEREWVFEPLLTFGDLAGQRLYPEPVHEVPAARHHLTDIARAAAWGVIASDVHTAFTFHELGDF